ncbi:integrase, catalytic region, zinc finger, CCHC-type containing protein [Tanacetum coccineum]
MEAEVDQMLWTKKTNEIEEKKNLLIENENLIVDFLSNELLYSVMNSVNTVSRFSELHDAFAVEQAHNVDFEAEISKLKYKIQKDDHNEEQLQERGNTIRELKEKISHLNKKRSEADLILDFKALDSRNKELTEHIKGKMKCVTIDTVKPKVLSLGVNCSTEASGSKPRSNTKNNRILSAKSVNKKKVEDPPWNNKSNLKQKNRVDSSISYKHTVIQIVLWYLDSGCSKHMTGNRLRLKNFIKKFIETVTFGNDHFGAIIGYRDYVIGDSILKLHSEKFVVMLELIDVGVYSKGSRGLILYTIFVKDMMMSSYLPYCPNALQEQNHDNGTEFVNQVLTEFNESVSIFHQKSVLRTPQQNDVVERRNCTIVEAARTMLLFSKALMFLWAKVVATAFFGALYYPTNDSDDLE